LPAPQPSKKETIQKLSTFSKKIKRKFLLGKKVKPPVPEFCSICGMKGSDCLIHWGFYRVNNKQDIVATVQNVFFYYIHRLYCKTTRRTISLLPDFLHPRKRYTHKFVKSVFDRIIGSKNSRKRTGREMQIHFQTIQKWLSNFSGNRNSKSICFSFCAPELDWHHSSVPGYCAIFWRLLKKSFSNKSDEPMRTATRLLWEGFECPLY